MSFLYPFQEAGSHFSGRSWSKKHSHLFHTKKKKTFLLQCLHWIVVLVPKTVKKGGITLPPFVSFPLLPSLWSASPVADLISMFFSHILWDYSLHPSPVHLTYVYFPQAFVSMLKCRVSSVMQHKPAVYQVPEAAVIYLACQPCLDFSLFRCVLDALPYSSGRDTASPSSSSSSNCAQSPPGEEPGVLGWSRLCCGGPNASELTVPAGLLCSFLPVLPWITLRHNIVQETTTLEQTPSAVATQEVKSKIANTAAIRYSVFWCTFAWTFRDPSSSQQLSDLQTTFALVFLSLACED